jgi:ribonuclease J
MVPTATSSPSSARLRVDDPAECALVPTTLNPSGLHFLPLGGTGEIGMNCNLYHHAGRWLMVDCGVMFGREGVHDMHALYADPSFAVLHRDSLEGLVVTHAHQDHLGAIADVWPDLRCRVYATRFAAALLVDAFAERGLQGKVPLIVIPERARLRLGPFDLQRIPMTHSTVEMGALVIRTAGGAVLHTGDFKLDPHPVMGSLTDELALRALAREQLAAVVSDSTNADHEGTAGSEASLFGPLVEQVEPCTGRVAVTLFASNVARVHTLGRVAARTGRHLVLLGRSLERMVRAATDAGWLADLPVLVDPRDYGWLPRDRVMVLCTGSQGEPRAALSKLAANQRSDVYLDPGDTVLFSARKIPGNELFVDRVVHLLRESGIRSVLADDATIHVSGHACRDELRVLYDWVKPQCVVPVHGTPAKLEAHSELAEERGLASARLRNGEILQLAPGPPRVVGSVRTGRLRRVEAEPERRGPLRRRR